jgi:hypothetical protein
LVSFPGPDFSGSSQFIYIYRQVIEHNYTNFSSFSMSGFSAIGCYPPETLKVAEPRREQAQVRGRLFPRPIADIFGLDFDVYVILAIPITGVLRPNASYK